jgi:hypothetical protein
VRWAAPPAPCAGRSPRSPAAGPVAWLFPVRGPFSGMWGQFGHPGLPRDPGLSALETDIDRPCRHEGASGRQPPGPTTARNCSRRSRST